MSKMDDDLNQKLRDAYLEVAEGVVCSHLGMTLGLIAMAKQAELEGKKVEYVTVETGSQGVDNVTQP